MIILSASGFEPAYRGSDITVVLVTPVNTGAMYILFSNYLGLILQQITGYLLRDSLHVSIRDLGNRVRQIDVGYSLSRLFLSPVIKVRCIIHSTLPEFDASICNQ